MKRLLVTGSRDWKDVMWLAEELKKAYRQFDRQAILVHGGAKGADQMAHDLWKEKVGEEFIEVYKPKYDKFPKHVAPLKRNQQMVDTKPDLVLAFQTPCSKTSCHEDNWHYSHGAQHTIDYAEQAGLEVRIFRDPPF